MKITGTLIKNFFHCKRQAYLYYYGLNFKNELVKTGENIHKEACSHEYVFEKIKIDDIKNDYLIEYKKSSSNLEGTKFQVLYYLNYFRKKGLRLKGKIKDLCFNDEHKVQLTIKNIRSLNKVIEEIKKLLTDNKIPRKLKTKKLCKGCSFFDYCWLE